MGLTRCYKTTVFLHLLRIRAQLLAPIVNAGGDNFCKWKDLQLISRLVTLTLTLERVILHTIVHHSATSTYRPNFIEIEETFVVERTHTDGRTFETGFIRSTLT